MDTIKIKKIKVYPDNKQFEAIIRRGESYILKFTGRTEQNRYELTSEVANWMLEHQKEKDKKDRRIPASALRSNLGIAVDEYEDRVYNPWYDYTNIKRIKGKRERLFILHHKIDEKSEIVEDIDKRLVFAKAFFKKDGKTINRAYYWLGDYRYTKIEPEISEDSDKDTLQPSATEIIHLPKIEDVLNKDASNEVNFPLSAGPQWIDFLEN